MVSQTKTHIFNVTYLGQPVYDIVMGQVVINKKIGLLDRTQVGAIFSLFVDAVKKPSPELPLGNPDIGVSMLAAIQRGAIEQPMTSYKNRGCMPLLTKAASKVMERIYEVVAQEKQAWAKRYCGDGPSPKPISNETWLAKVYESIYYFLQLSKDGALRLGGFGNRTSEEIWMQVTFPNGAPEAGLNKTKRVKADYYWDKNGRLGFHDPVISLNFGNSGFSDKDNMILNIISRNDKRKAAKDLDKDVCSLCETPFKRTNNRQKFCKDCGAKYKKTLNKLKGQEHRAHREGLGSVPSRDQPFARYLSNETRHSYTKADLVSTKELRPKTTKAQRKELRGDKPSCECGKPDLEIYKPWKPDESGKFGKIGAKVLYCKTCGLVHGYGVQGPDRRKELDN